MPLMKILGYFTKKDAFQLLKLFKKEGVEVQLFFDDKLDKLYKKTFPVNPPWNRRSSFTLPQMGWCFSYSEADKERINKVVLASPFSFYLKNEPRSEIVSSEDNRIIQPEEELYSSGKEIWMLIFFIVFLLIIAFCFAR